MSQRYLLKSRFWKSSEGWPSVGKRGGHFFKISYEQHTFRSVHRPFQFMNSSYLVMGKHNFHLLWEGRIYRAQVVWYFVERLCLEISRRNQFHWDRQDTCWDPEEREETSGPSSSSRPFATSGCNPRGWGAFGAHSNFPCATAKRVVPPPDLFICLIYTTSLCCAEWAAHLNGR